MVHFIIIFIALVSNLGCCFSSVRKSGIFSENHPNILHVGAIYYVKYNPNILIMNHLSPNEIRSIFRTYENANIYYFSSLSFVQEQFNDLIISNKNFHFEPYLVAETSGQQAVYIPEKIARSPTSILSKVSLNQLISFIRPMAKLRRDFTFVHQNATTINLDQWYHQNNIGSVDIVVLNSPGMESKIIQASPNVFHSAIEVQVNTYNGTFWTAKETHTEVNLLLHQFGYVKLTCWIEDNFIGRSLYVKENYFRGVFHRREI